MLGELEEYFAETMTPGDTFVFAGEVLRFESFSAAVVAWHLPPVPRWWGGGGAPGEGA